MTKNPFYNALLAIGYIVGLVSIVFFVPTFISTPEESIFYPMTALSALVLSVALMAYLFFYQPVVLFIDGQREKAVKFFLQTIAVFACSIVAILLIAFTVSK
jgi:hypothetical protein